MRQFGTITPNWEHNFHSKSNKTLANTGCDHQHRYIHTHENINAGTYIRMTRIWEANWRGRSVRKENRGTVVNKRVSYPCPHSSILLHEGANFTKKIHDRRENELYFHFLTCTFRFVKMQIFIFARFSFFSCQRSWKKKRDQQQRYHAAAAAPSTSWWLLAKFINFELLLLLISRIILFFSYLW